MAKRRDKKSGSRKRRKKQRQDSRGPLFTWSVVPVSPAELEEFRAAAPPGAVLADQDKLTWMGSIDADIAAFELEVCGTDDPSPAALLVGSVICGELWDRRGAAADWQDLDVDAVIDSLGWLHERDQDSVHVFLSSLITWLANNGRLCAASAIAKLDALRLREPPGVRGMRAAIASMPEEALAAVDARRLKRVADAREHRRRMN